MADKGKQIQLIHGTDEYQVANEARKRVAACCPEADQALKLETIDGAVDTVDEAIEAVRNTLEALRTVGFFDASKTVWLRSASFLSDAEPGRYEDVKKAVTDLTEEIKGGIMDGVTLIVSASKVDKRSAFFKTMQAGGDVAEFSGADKPWNQEKVTASFARDAFKDAGLTISGRELDAFLQRTGTNSRQIIQEIAKLQAYLGTRNGVRLEDIAAVVSFSKESAGWDLADAIAYRQLDRALALIPQLLFQGFHAVAMMYVLEPRLQELLIIRDCLDRHWVKATGDEGWPQAVWTSHPDQDGVFEALGWDPRTLNKFRVGHLCRQAMKYTQAELKEAITLALETHRRLVTTSIDPAIIMELFAIRVIAGKAAHAA